MLQRPCGAPVSRFGSFQEHLDRDSPEPGVDYAAAYGTDILAAEEGTVDDIKRTNDGAMGRYVRVSLKDGRTVRYLHLSEVLVELNATVVRGSLLGRSGGSGEGEDRHYDSHVHASLWTGKAWQSDLVDFELNAGGAAFAGRIASPTRVEDDDMIALKIRSRGKVFLCALGPGIFRHFISQDPFEKIKNIMRIQDDWQEITLNELNPLLRTYGCDLKIWDVRNGDFAVLDPLNGTIKPGNMWSAAGAVRAAINGLFVPVIDNDPALEEDQRFRDDFERNFPGLEPVAPVDVDPNIF
ncbi:M23 family metallopeptidase [Microbacterium sp. NPDC019599]|uniref:M23 family metallopeptidase n=1 Tax=Microbacterium sp. NPDC019599 TaxID=3154690 RepID=UPI0033E366BE